MPFIRLIAFTLLLQSAYAIDIDIRQTGAVADGATVNTEAIQIAIDQIAEQQGGTVIVPSGTFVSGALFLKPKVHLRLDEGAVIRCSPNAEDFPEQKTRIEGHFEDAFTPALINADSCHGISITGSGTLDGDGRPIWDLFWKLRRAASDSERSDFKNTSIPRARLALIENCNDIRIEGITFKDSQFWNLHLYNCDGVEIVEARFIVPDDYRQAPSSDGIDIDSSRNVSISGCYFSVTDDAIALKGSKGPLALEDTSSPPVENIRISQCDFRRAHSAITCGSEATIVRNVRAEDCTVRGNMPLLRLKLRTDTPQLYEDISISNFTVENPKATLVMIAPWSQYADLKGMPQPQSTVRNISLSQIHGKVSSLGRITGHETSQFANIAFREIGLTAINPSLATDIDVEAISIEKVIVNGKPYQIATESN